MTYLKPINFRKIKSDFLKDYKASKLPRSFYAKYLRDALPYASFIGFTGTPVALEERDTRAVFGDYVAGPSHVLPTGGTARFSSPLNMTDFVKFINLVTVDETGLKQLAQAASTIARAEGFEAHARAVEERLRKTENYYQG